MKPAELENAGKTGLGVPGGEAIRYLSWRLLGDLGIPEVGASHIATPIFLLAAHVCTFKNAKFQSS